MKAQFTALLRLMIARQRGSAWLYDAGQPNGTSTAQAPNRAAVPPSWRRRNAVEPWLIKRSPRLYSSTHASLPSTTAPSCGHIHVLLEYIQRKIILILPFVLILVIFSRLAKEYQNAIIKL